MRPAARLFAAVSQTGQRLLEPGAPTGLTGLRVHPAPRSTLIYLYSSTLSKLQKIPDTSVYRQATEALTKKRLAIIEGVKPAGYDLWDEKMQFQLSELLNKGITPGILYEGRQFVIGKMWKEKKDPRETEWDGEVVVEGLEGAQTEEAVNVEVARYAEKVKKDVANSLDIEPEPPFSEDQVTQLEEQFGSGLLEEVIQVAEGENRLVNIMIENKVWEDLEEKAPEGQWSYFERSNTGTTSAQ